jgi:hypothetical protein
MGKQLVRVGASGAARRIAAQKQAPSRQRVGPPKSPDVAATVDVSVAWDQAWAEERRASEGLSFGVGDHGGDEAAFQAKLAQYVGDVIPLADSGHLDASLTLLWFVLLAVQEDGVLLPLQLKQWFQRFVFAVEDDPCQSARALLTRRYSGGRSPNHADDLASTFGLARIKRTACRTVRRLIETAGSECHRLRCSEVLNRASSYLARDISIFLVPHPTAITTGRRPLRSRSVVALIVILSLGGANIGIDSQLPTTSNYGLTQGS